ncbi:NAD(P)-binding protein [Rhizodiscina lignyota]|uniref:NAD(P)-binding protein n=1 Tax=Rhizodiscina lignyota TaxID=1504668 RepID=A0A9P4I874_9PEZI|nr:NAD(P)-binding protein [Rhizodiscina lignyota]
MSSQKLTAIVFGAGARTGRGIADGLLAAGYNVTAVSRSITESEDLAKGALNIKADLSDLASIKGVFEKTKKLLGTPNIVIHNAWASVTPKADDWFSQDLTEMQKAYNTNSLSVLVAAQEAVAGFETLPASAPQLFIYVGNMQNVSAFPSPGFVALGMGKSATSYLIWAASQNFESKGYKFYFVDERTPDGGAVYGDIDAKAHTELFLSLAKGDNTVPWHATFVKGKGYVKFPNSIV